MWASLLSRRSLKDFPFFSATPLPFEAPAVVIKCLLQFKGLGPVHLLTDEQIVLGFGLTRGENSGDRLGEFGLAVGPTGEP
jgi:hypothetical protein